MPSGLEGGGTAGRTAPPLCPGPKRGLLHDLAVEVEVEPADLGFLVDP